MPAIWQLTTNRRCCDNPWLTFCRHPPWFLVLVDVTGATLATLLDEIVHPGSHSFLFDLYGQQLTSIHNGVYFLHLESPGVRESRKFLLLR